MGFTLKGYPHDGTTLAWGAALGVATLLATLVAARLAERGKSAAFLAAFGTYELGIASFAMLSRSGLAAFTPAVVLEIGSTNALIALALVALYAVSGAAEAAIVRGRSLPT